MSGPLITTHLLADDGIVPNNPGLPMIVYRQCLELGAVDPDHCVQNLFLENGWGKCWIDGIFSFQHYHSTAHEILGISRGWAKVQFGGPNGGMVLTVRAGDAVLLPAGTGHCNLGASRDLSVVGAYPPGQDWDLLRDRESDRLVALGNIPHVPLPETDPVFGAEGPVKEHWRV